MGTWPGQRWRSSKAAPWTDAAPAYASLGDKDTPRHLVVCAAERRKAGRRPGPAAGNSALATAAGARISSRSRSSLLGRKTGGGFHNGIDFEGHTGERFTRPPTA